MTAARLVTTRISEREQRPRSLRSAISGGYARAARPVRPTPLPPNAKPHARGNIGRQFSPYADPLVVLPRHVRACQWSQFGHERWFIWLWQHGRAMVQTRVPYSCGSWRCPVCARHEAAVTFARIKEATSRAEYSAGGWVMIVLTLDREGYYSGKPWPDVNAAYRELSRMTRNFLARLRRAYGHEPGSSWVAVVEAHRSGWPHVNLLAYAPSLAAELAAQQCDHRPEEPARQRILLAGHLLRTAEATGWGRQSTAEVARSKDAIASYIVKLAGQHDASVGEVAKITQAPMNAPERFHRLRSGKGFLPPRHRNPNVTGVLVRRRRSPEGDWEIERVNPPKDPSQEDPIRQAIAAEVQLIQEEEGLLATYGSLPPMPPLRFAIGAELKNFKTPPPKKW